MIVDCFQMGGMDIVLRRFADLTDHLHLYVSIINMVVKVQDEVIHLHVLNFKSSLIPTSKIMIFIDILLCNKWKVLCQVVLVHCIQSFQSLGPSSIKVNFLL